MVYQQKNQEEDDNKRKEKYNLFVEKIHEAWKGSKVISAKDKEELFENLLQGTYPLLEKVSKKLISVFTLVNQVELTLKDIFYMNMIIDLYDPEDNHFQSIATIGLCIGAIDSIKGIINNLPFGNIIGKLQQEKALNDFREFQAANADTKQIPDSGDAERGDRTPNND